MFILLECLAGGKPMTMVFVGSAATVVTAGPRTPAEVRYRDGRTWESTRSRATVDLAVPS